MPTLTIDFEKNLVVTNDETMLIHNGIPKPSDFDVKPCLMQAINDQNVTNASAYEEIIIPSKWKVNNFESSVLEHFIGEEGMLVKT